MSHVGYPGGHHTEVALLTGVAPEGVRFGDIRNTISLDQEVASRLGGETRFPYLALGGGVLSWNRKGVKVPSEERATQVFKQLFIDGTPEEVAREVERIKTGQSILDGVRDQARSLGQTLGPADRRRLDLMLTSIREAEQRLQQDQGLGDQAQAEGAGQASHRRLPQRSAGCWTANGNGSTWCTWPCKPIRRA